MSSRYGRNQRRKHRQEISELKSTVDFLLSRLRMADYRADNAKQEALNYFMENTGLMKHATDRVCYELGRAVGKELEPHARRLFETSKRKYDEAPIAFSMSATMLDRRIEVLRGEVRPLIYNIALA